MSFTFTLPTNIRPIKNPWFHVECTGLQDYVVHFITLPKDYHAVALNATRRPSSTHRSLHGKERGRRSFDLEAETAETDELVELIREVVVLSAPMFNFDVEKLRINSANWLLYEEDLGCPPHCDDQDPADAEYGMGSTVFNWANQLVALLYTSELGTDFEGGELLLHNQEQVIRPHRGEIVIFPATYTHVHSVQPITKGVRTVMQTTWRFDDRD